MVEFIHSFSLFDTQTYAHLTGDTNPIHTDVLYAQQHGHDNVIVHGLLVTSLFGTTIGRLKPGALYVSQEITFHHPICIERDVRIQLKVEKYRQRLLHCSTIGTFVDTNQIALSGKARVYLNNNTILN